MDEAKKIKALKSEQENKSDWVYWLIIALAITSILKAIVIYGLITQHPPETIVVYEPTSTPEQAQGNDVNVTINNVQQSEPIMATGRDTHIQIIRFTNIVPEAIGQRYIHGQMLMTPVRCFGTNICAVEVPPMQTNHHYCISYRTNGPYKCVPVNPLLTHVDIEVTE